MNPVPIDNLIAAARAYIGTPFAKHARAKGAGIDCTGLLICSSRDAGVPVPDFVGYSFPPRPEAMISELEKMVDPIKRDDLRIGDVMVFSVRGTEPSHLGITTPIGLIHASWTRGRSEVIEHRITASFARRFHSAYRPRGFTLSPLFVTWPNPRDEFGV